MTDEYYNTEEACMLLKLGRTTVYKLLKSGKLKSTKVGRSYRILGQDIKSFMQNKDNWARRRYSKLKMKISIIRNAVNDGYLFLEWMEFIPPHKSFQINILGSS